MRGTNICIHVEHTIKGVKGWHLFNQVLPLSMAGVLNQVKKITQCQYDMKFFDLRNLPEFYQTILNYWQNFKLLTVNDKVAQNQIILNNSNILVDGKPILYITPGSLTE